MCKEEMNEQKDILILAIESSCDETAAAVVKNGREVQLCEAPSVSWSASY